MDKADNGRRQSKWETKIQQLLDDIRHMEADNEERRAVLAQCEWLADDGEHRCPVCGGYKDTGHTTNCPLAAALAD